MAQTWPPAERPTEAEVAARRAVVTAALEGDLEPARAALDHESDRVRASALKALGAGLAPDTLETAVADPSMRVRRMAAELAARDLRIDLAVLLDDIDPTVVEMACWAAGERAERASELIGTLARISADHDDAICRESAVAALGAIGDPTGLPAILAATGDRATVRRRAIIALAPFDGPEVEAALERALEDRDWQVRQAAEDLSAPAETP